MSDERDSDNPWSGVPEAKILSENIINRDIIFEQAENAPLNGEVIINPEITQKEDQ